MLINDVNTQFGSTVYSKNHYTPTLKKTKQKLLFHSITRHLQFDRGSITGNSPFLAFMSALFESLYKLICFRNLYAKKTLYYMYFLV